MFYLLRAARSFLSMYLPRCTEAGKSFVLSVCSGKESVKSTPTLKSTTQAFCPNLPGLISLFKASLQAAVDYIVAVREGKIFQNTISYSLVGLSSIRLSESVVRSAVYTIQEGLLCFLPHQEMHPQFQSPQFGYCEGPRKL